MHKFRRQAVPFRREHLKQIEIVGDRMERSHADSDSQGAIIDRAGEVYLASTRVAVNNIPIEIQQPNYDM